MVEYSDAVLRIMSEENSRATNNIDPSRLALLRKGQGPIAAGYTQRIVENRPHCLTLFPTEAYAQDAEMSLSDRGVRLSRLHAGRRRRPGRTLARCVATAADYR